MKPILLGLDNPHSGNPEFALWPSPNGCSGHRLWKMLNAVNPEKTSLDYIDEFDRRNIRDGIKIKTFTNRTVVVLGDDVRKILNKTGGLSKDVEQILIHPQRIDGVTWRLVPHPSGRSIHYNNPTTRLLVGILLADLLEESEKWQKGRQLLRSSQSGGPRTATSSRVRRSPTR